MVCLGFKPRFAGWYVKTNPLSYSDPSIILAFYSIVSFIRGVFIPATIIQSVWAFHAYLPNFCPVSKWLKYFFGNENMS